MKDELKQESIRLQNQVKEILVEIQDSTKLTPNLIDKLKTLQSKLECIYNLIYKF